MRVYGSSRESGSSFFLKNDMKKRAGIIIGGCLLLLTPTLLQADTPVDLPGVITAVGAYWTAVLQIGIGIILFVVGRKVLMKLDDARGSEEHEYTDEDFYEQWEELHEDE